MQLPLAGSVMTAVAHPLTLNGLTPDASYDFSAGTLPAVVLSI